MTEQPVESVFARAWTLLTTNWIIIVPGVIVGIIVGVASGLLAPAYVTYDANGVPVTSVSASVFGSAVLALIALIGYIATVAYTTGMAGAAWTRGVTSLADGTAIFERDFSRIVIVAVALLVLAVIAVILAIPTLGLSLVAFYLFTLYAMPSAIVGDRPAMDAIRESFALTVARFVPTLIIAIVIFVLKFLGGVIGGVFHFTPLIGPIIAAIITQIVVAYAALVVVGEYLNLQQAGRIPPATVTPGP
ncbi:MAG: hypothetical protein ABR975_09940 [Vulcanimicrobiaceae bacterium]|jgi:hypothetical protein